MKKIAVMLPIPYKGGSLRAAKNIAKSIAYQARERGDEIQVVFSYVKINDYDINLDFSDLIKEKIILRETEWKVFPKESLRAAASLLKVNQDIMEFDEFCLPTDGANDFNDCDLWIIISDRLRAPLFPLKKNAFVIYDYIQRYVPKIFNDVEYFWDNLVKNFFSSVRHCSKVFVTTPSTQQDLISYTGVPKNRIHLVELDFQPPEKFDIDVDIDILRKYIIWPTNTSLHKNHLTAIKAYEIYLRELGGSYDLVITGTWTKMFDPKNILDDEDPFLKYSHIKKIRKLLRYDNSLAKRIKILGNVPERIYFNLIKNAQFLWHPVLYDNGTFSVLEAAYLGVPSISAKYPAMDYINQKYELNLEFFNPRNVVEIAEALKKMESSAKTTALPKKEQLERFGWKNLSSSIYNEIVELL